MMTVATKRIRVSVLAGLLIAVTSWSVSAATPTPHPQAAEIKRRLEFFRLKVVEVSFAPKKGATAPVWAAVTVATYQQPSVKRVVDQAFTIWNVMFAVLRRESPETVLLTGQDWKTFRLFFNVPLKYMAEFDAGVAANKPDAVDVLMKRVRFFVFDRTTQKLIDANEFRAKYFVPD